MPDLNSTVNLIFNGDNRVGTAVNGALADVARFNAGVQSVTAPAAQATQSLLQLEAQILRLAASYGGQALTASLALTSAQTDLARVLGDSGPPVEAFANQVSELATQFGTTGANVTGAIAGWVRAGFEAQEAGQLTGEALALVVAGEVDVTEATEILVRNIRGFGLSVDEVRPSLDQLNFVSDNTSTTLAQLAEGTARLAPLASGLGFSFQEIVAILTPVVEQFQSAEIASRGLRTTFLNLSDPTDAVIQTMENLGVALRDGPDGTTGNLRSVRDILQDLAPAFAGLEGPVRSQTAAIIAGKDQAAILSTVLQEWNRVQEVLNLTTRASGSIQGELDRVSAGLAFRVQGLTAAFERLDEAIGVELQPVVSDSVDGFTNIANALEEIVATGGANNFFQQLAPTFAEIARLANELAEALPAAFESADFSAIGEGLDALFGDLSQVEIDAGDVQAFLEGIAEGFRTLSQFSGGVIDAFQGVGAVLGPLVDLVANMDEDTANLLGVFGGGAIVLNSFASALSPILVGLAALSVIGVPLVPVLAGVGAGVAAIGAAAAISSNPITRLQEDTERYNELARQTAETTEREIAELQEFRKGLSDMSDVQRSVLPSAEEFRANLVAQNDELDILNGELIRVPQRLEAVRSATQEAARDNELLLSSTRVLVATYDEFGRIIPVVSEPLEVAFQNAGDAAAEAERQSASFLQTMEQIASNERIALIEARVELDAAGIDAEARRVIAAFESINAGIDSTGDLLGGLFSLFAETEGLEQNFIENAIEQEQRRRDQEFELQRDLIEAQIDLFEQRSQAIRRGDAQIRIETTDSMSNILRVLLEEIIREIQIFANAEGQELILGSPV